jgi:peptide/nickel transport system ATP-binding protein
VAPLLEINDLRTEIRLRHGVVHAVDGVTLHVEPGETVGIVGESGCGKTMTALSIMNLLPGGGSIVGGSIKLAGQELSTLSDENMRDIRGNEIGMIFQDPLTSLNPTMTVGKQISEVVSLHRDVSKEQAMDRAAEVLDLVGIPRVQERIKEYPHQFSGGMRQRVMIAMALACEPKLLIADEPTTALDVTIQKQILELIDDLRLRLGMSVILVTHDLGVIAGRADRVAVMYAGKIAEVTDTETLFARPRHPYTEALFQALPDKAAEAGERLYSIPGLPPDLVNPPKGCRFAARCRYVTDRCRDEEPTLTGEVAGHEYRCFYPVGPSERRQSGKVVDYNETAPAPEFPVQGPGIGDELLKVDHLVKDYPVTRGAVLQRRVGWLSAVADVNFSIRSGETFGLVGESGCGKSTIGKLVVGLETPTSGSIDFEGRDLAKSSGKEYRRERRNIQLMFQDSYASLDPRMRAGTLLREPLVIQGIGSKQEQLAKVGEMLDKVGLPRSAADRYPHEFSGGQRQRLGFARALMLNPQLIVADEPVSALDVSIQAQVLNMMKELQRDLGLTYLFISHDLGVVRYLSEKIGVMYLGKLVEIGPAEEVYLRPAHPYTRGLLDSAPVADPVAEKAKVNEGVTGELPSAIHPPSGCRFRTRCPKAQAVCADVEPPMTPFGGSGHFAACHFPLEIPVGAPVSASTQSGPRQ